MKFLLLLLLCAAVFVISWPLMLLLLLALPFLWLVALPFRLAAMVLEASLALLGALLFLPARILGARR